MKTPALAGLAWMLAANTLFVVMTIAAKLAARSAFWPTIAASRAVVGAAVAVAFALRTGASLRTRDRSLTWARSLFGTCSMLATFYALGSPTLAAGDAATLFATTPILIALLSPRLLGERTDGRLWIILFVAFAGVALVAGPLLRRSPCPLGALVGVLLRARDDVPPQDAERRGGRAREGRGDRAPLRARRLRGPRGARRLLVPGARAGRLRLARRRRSRRRDRAARDDPSLPSSWAPASFWRSEPRGAPAPRPASASSR